MLAPASVAAVDASGTPQRVQPHPSYNFASIPGTVLRLLGDERATGVPGLLEGERFERTILVLLDAFGWAFLQRHADHPFVRRLTRDGAIAKLTTQFPSTTTAHIPTICSGLPVGVHGLYEWNVYEPAIDRVITPLLFSYAGTLETDQLVGSGVEPEAFVPESALTARLAELGREALALQPNAIADSSFTRAALAGMRRAPYEDLAGGLATARDARAASTYLYWPEIDKVGHMQGPSSEAFDAAIVTALDALHATFAAPQPGTVLLLCADHGQVDVHPDRIDYVDELAPGLEALRTRDRDGTLLYPAGSARDLFLHVREDRVDEAIVLLAGALGERATVHATADLVREGVFGEAVGPRLRERLAEICVLPAPGRQVWLRQNHGLQQSFLGHHGGLDRAEAETYLAALPLG